MKLEEEGEDEYVMLNVLVVKNGEVKAIVPKLNFLSKLGQLHHCALLEEVVSLLIKLGTYRLKQQIFFLKIVKNPLK